jgi:DNA-3-methyladenine glycosylase I
MCFIIFFSGFRASVVEKKLDVITEYFNSYLKVSDYTEVDFNKIMNDQRMIKNQQKIRAIINNSKVFIELIKKHGSFKQYLDSFGVHVPRSLKEIPDFPDYQVKLDALSDDLTMRFGFLGPATVNHYLTNLGFPVLKPDRMVMRAMFRSHLVASEDDLRSAIVTGQRISILLDLPVSYVDSVFVSLGMTSDANICEIHKPKCNICELEKICGFYK